MIQGVLLAAGSARRFGGPKLLQAEWRGEPIAQLALRNLRQVVPDVVAVVNDPESPLAELLRSGGARTVTNPDPSRGMGSSIAAAVGASTQAGAWLIALADMPWVQPRTIAAVVAALRKGAPVAVPRHAGRRGHPVGFGAAYRTQLLALELAPGGRGLLKDPAAIQFIDVDDPGVLLDVDRPADLQKVRELLDRDQ